MQLYKHVNKCKQSLTEIITWLQKKILCSHFQKVCIMQCKKVLNCSFMENYDLLDPKSTKQAYKHVLIFFICLHSRDSIKTQEHRYVLFHWLKLLGRLGYNRCY